MTTTNEIETKLKTYIEEIEAWRKKREADLRAPDSWLSLAGLYELSEGEHRIGSADDNDILLPASAPAHLGRITFKDNQATLHLNIGVPVLVDGQAVNEAVLTDNDDGARKPTHVTTGSVTFFVHRYGRQHFGIRIKDSQNQAIKDFSGCVWYEVKPEYRVRGRFVPYKEAQPIEVSTTVNTIAEYQSPGVLQFELHGQRLQILVTSRSGNKLYLLLRDATSGKTTYGAVRFLTAEIDDENNVDLDFNKTYSPPCAFTPYATCPLPPRENILPITIEAGELYEQH